MQKHFGLMLILLSLVGSAAHAQLAVSFSDRGIASLRYGEREMLHPEPMRVDQLDLRHGFPPTPVQVPPAEPRVIFDSQSRRLTESYSWGSLACAYGVEGDRLNLDFAIQNTTKDSIFSLTASVLQLQLPGDVKIKGWAHGWPAPSVLTDAPQILDVSYEGGSLVICNAQVDRPLWFNLERVQHSDTYNLVIRHDGPPRGAEISGGDGRAYSLSVRFGPVGANSLTLAPDVYKSFAQRFPSELKWEDRRPIGCNFLSSIESRSNTNPTGWLHDSTVDMTTDAGRADWRKRILARADKSVAVARELNCQGVITWDIEGQREPHAISYIGDPRLMPVISPEMDGIADAFFKKYTDAGLRCGVTIRPTHVVRALGAKNEWEHINVDDIVAELAGKIAYAKKRWGCTLFYVDSTMRWDVDAAGHFDLHTLPAEFFESLHRQFPDVLLIPEESSTRHYAYCAPYHEVMPPHNFTGTPDTVKAVYPDAFSMIRVADASIIEKNADALTQAVKGGDIIMFRTWLDDPDNIPVKKILQNAGVLR